MYLGMGLPPAKKRKLAVICIGSELFFGHEFKSQTQILLCFVQRMQTCQLNWFLNLPSDKHVRIDSYFEDWLPKYLDHDFYLLFRMRRNTFHKLLNTIEKYIFSRKYHGRAEVMLSISDRFNVARSTVFNCITCILNLSEKLIKLFIKWPTISQARYISSKFQDIAGFPGVIGAIDGCHIHAKVPKAQHDSYQDRKFQHSISIQAICTHSKLFINFASGYPGSLHDARMLRESHLQKNIIDHGEQRYFYGKYHLVGDSAYPCKTWLMCPYRDTGNLTREEKYFNSCLSRTRVKIENSFGLLKSRWRILKSIDTYSVKRAVDIINTCAMLHNFCILQGDYQDEEPSTGEDSTDGCSGEDDTSGVTKRFEILQFLWDNKS